MMLYIYIISSLQVASSRAGALESQLRQQLGEFGQAPLLPPRIFPSVVVKIL